MSHPGPYSPPDNFQQSAFPAPVSPAVPQKSFLTTWLLSLFLGGLGVDRFYLGKIGTGILKLVTGGGFGIWSLVDLIITVAGKQTDKNRQPLEGYTRHKVVALVVTGVLLVGGVVSGVVGGMVASTAIMNASTLPAGPAISASEEPEPSVQGTPDESPASEETPIDGELATQTFSGTGNDIKTADLSGLPAVVTFTCESCTGKTTLKTNGAEGLLVNAIGAHSGSYLIDVEDGTATSQFTIEADSDWTLVVKDVSSIEPSSGAVKGHGDQVVFLAGTSTKAAITNNGEGSFVVLGFGGDFPEFPVNELGSYSGTVELTAGFIQVISDGDWTITAK